MKKIYVLKIRGCDDKTVFTVELTDEERDLMINICKMSHLASDYGCQPDIDIYNYNDLEEPWSEDEYDQDIRNRISDGTELNKQITN